MARTELPHGVILPAEYSDDWYEDMTSNLTKLDDVIGSDADKLSAGDVGAAALSNDYTDLDNKPTIPTKTSDLTNDSNFVDTSNSAVASGITSAKVTSYDGHIADTDIHVTTADKTKWNTVALIKQSRLVNTQVGSATTIAFANIDDTNGIKVGDKCMDLDAKMFEITAVDTANQTVTVGSALIDLALDGNVVHTSGNETIAGQKTFTNNVQVKNNDVTIGSTTGSGYKAVTYTDSNDNELSRISVYKNTNGSTALDFKVSSTDNTDTVISSSFQFFVSKSGSKVLNPTTSDEIALGRSTNKWLNVATSKVNNLEPSSLSLPSDRSSRVDISGYFTNTANGDTNTYTAVANGWIFLSLNDVTAVNLASQTSGGLTNYGDYRSRSSNGALLCLFPIRSGDVFVTQWYTTTTVTVTNAYFIPCQGNI